MLQNEITQVAEAIYQLTEYRFSKKELLIEALSHPSLKQNTNNKLIIKDYERLELFGDSILNFIITEFLFSYFTNHDEGKLAKIRSFLICKETICKIATKINLAEHIIMTKGEENSGGRFNQNNLENALEALIAAVYLDSDMDSTRIFVKKLWSEFLHNIDTDRTDSKTDLQEWAQKNGYNKPIYEIASKTGPDHAPYFVVLAKVGPYHQIGEGNSIKEAEKESAKKILHLIKL